MRGLVESRLGFSRQNQQVRRTGIDRYTWFGRFLEDDMRVRSAHAGGHHAGSSRTFAGPFPQARVHVKRSAGEIDFGIGLLEVEARGDLVML